MHFLRGYFIASLAGVLSGLASALFLYSIEGATHLRESYPWLILLLPMGGFAIGWIYHRWGRGLEGGSNLLLDEIHDPKATIPMRMAPMILAGTVITNIFGGSAGREGTAVQMGGSIAAQLAKWLQLSGDDRRMLLVAGMSAGFGSVFGVPFAGAVFGIEVLRIGRREWPLFGECLVASLVAHFICLGCGVHHTVYPSPEIPQVSFSVFALIAVSGVAFGFCASVFTGFTHFISLLFKRIRSAPLRPAVGGVMVALGFFVMGTDRFAGLGVPVIVEALSHWVPVSDFAWKLLFTSLTLGSGFKGGEVTPLLYIGATLGNSLGHFLMLPFSLLASLGFVAVFAAAANTPFACTVMAMEIFGPKVGAFAFVACMTSYFFSSRRGIYSSQKI